MASGDEEHGGALSQVRAETAWLQGRRGEQITFAVLAVLIWPFIAVAVVGGYGFLVWMFQLLAGPPGPPAG